VLWPERRDCCNLSGEGSGAYATRKDQAMSNRYVIDEKGRRVGVLLDVEEYERMVEELEELEDIRDVREVREAIERGEENVVSWEQAKREIEAERAELRSRGEL